jgi:hypothetical protein
MEEYFSKLLNVHRVSDVRQIEIHTAEPLVPDPGLSDVEITTAKLKECTVCPKSYGGVSKQMY